jgi:rubrerythrin
MGDIYVGDLTLIFRDETPPSYYFFSKKRKAIVRKEIYMREGVIVKKHRVLIDSQKLEEEDFSTEIIGSMGAMATKNIFTVENMRTRINKCNHMIIQLQDQLKNTGQKIREEVNKSLEQARAVESQEIQSLKTSLDEMNQRIQVSQAQAAQWRELLKQL